MNIPSLDSLRVLETIARRGSFAAAASELDRVPSALSYTVQKLEEELGVTLFRREGRRAVLTPAGQVLASGATRLLNQSESLAEEARRTATGWESNLAIAIDTTADRTPIWQAIQSLYEIRPEIYISLTEQVLGGTWEALFQDRVDLIIGAVEHLPDQYQANRQGIVIHPWLPVDMCVVAAPDHPACRDTPPLTAETARLYRGVVVADTSTQFRALSRGLFGDGQTLYVDTMQEKLAAHLNGMGIGQLPRHLAANHIANGNLVELETDFRNTAEPTCLAHRTSHHGNALQLLVSTLLAST